jgi:hypothetical protein
LRKIKAAVALAEEERDSRIEEIDDNCRNHADANAELMQELLNSLDAEYHDKRTKLDAEHENQKASQQTKFDELVAHMLEEAGKRREQYDGLVTGMNRRAERMEDKYNERRKMQDSQLAAVKGEIRYEEERLEKKKVQISEEIGREIVAAEGRLADRKREIADEIGREIVAANGRLAARKKEISEEIGREILAADARLTAKRKEIEDEIAEEVRKWQEERASVDERYAIDIKNETAA